ncbi:MAG: preprotein translocase subunit SecA [Rhodospirillaceae bacterium]|jgi:preprotein translocase subunit SecA|nr:preprotein translocase subunit SecA [Rhodospirillaceae bacterium]MBT7769643.1 preprotein translocase subunit SecA [Rhodospirillales bacterium]MBT4701853.1 preprotein translocase subunit SecA [Rhodospirillaceae bacterium]MBT5036392.1 preprotein translocase subunit SecA [Rhodospirillaceae bacterium]MBT6221541.1 preprotein translocase subunit SecA [Rhodospirillaceae bacterium]
MFGAIAQRMFGSSNDRYLKPLQSDVDAINALEPELEKLSDEDLAARTPWLRGRLEQGEDLDAILVDAFATVREAAKRTLGQRHYDVQLLGGIILHRGIIAEMKTGEGKTLSSTLPVYLNALSGDGVHVVTVNDYLAKRDAEWMGQVYQFLGLSVGCIVHDLDDTERKAAYGADVTYATNNELGFDYLRDNMKFDLEEMAQREFNYAIVDEVDSILIDEARTPLIISGPTEDASELYSALDKLIPKLEPSDYEKDEKARAATYTDAGTEKLEQILRDEGLLETGSLYDIQNVSLVHHANQALRAHILFARDTDYIVKDNKVIIIDEFTGRMMEGRRYSEGLHQALEAKEHVEIQTENQTLASITFQNYFRLYPKLAGMTGTAMTEAGEFSEIYKLNVVDIPTNLPAVREDFDDEVYRTADEKNASIVDLIADCQKRNQPVLVGTVSIEKSEHLSALLKKKKVVHQVLNARYHEQEASIISEAGAPGAITIATNMAGRGTDIQLGGNFDMRVAGEVTEAEGPERDKHIEKIQAEIEEKKQIVIAAGGLFIMGTERHESRRIDNQLRGRSGRQGDPGASKFYLSLEDDLMRIFGSERIDSMLQKLGLEDGEAIVHPWVNKALEKAQGKVEERNFEIRKNLLKFDDVMNDQRKAIYEQRKDLMKAETVNEDINDMRHQVIEDMVAAHIPEKAYAEQWDMAGLHEEVLRVLGMDIPVADWAKEEGIADAEIISRLTEMSNRAMAEKAVNFGPDVMRTVEKSLLLQLLDQTWKEHLLTLDHLRQGIGLRAYGQRDPLNEYKSEAFDLFSAMLENLRETVTQTLAHIELQVEPTEEDLYPQSDQEMMETREDPAFQNLDSTPEQLSDDRPLAAPMRSREAANVLDPDDASTWGRVSRNQTCPCGSGKKYKHCHGKLS